MQNPNHANLTLNKKLMIIAIVALIVSIPIFVLAMFNWPLSDDFAYSIATKHAVDDGKGIVGVIDAAIKTSGYYYENWQGLYVQAFLSALQPDIYHAYWLTTFIIVGAIFAGFAIFYYGLQRLLNNQPRLYWLGATIISTLFFVESLPDIEEGLYWFNGALNYLVFTAFFLALYGFIALAAKTCTAKPKVIFIVCATILAFVVSGGNHVTAFINILVLLCLLALNLRKQWIIITPPLIASAIGFAISLSSPGTAIRQARLDELAGGNLPGFFDTLKSCLYNAFNMTSEWLTPGLLLFLALLTPFLLACRPKDFKVNRLVLAVLAIAPFAVTWLAYCPPYYACGAFGAGRIHDCVYLLFLISITVLYGYIVFAIDVQYNIKESLSIDRLTKSNMIIFCFLVLLFMLPIYGHNSTSQQALSEITHGNAQAYAQAQEARYNEIISSEEGEVIMLTTLPRCGLLYDEPEPSSEASIYNSTMKPNSWIDDSDNYYRREFIYEDSAD